MSLPFAFNAANDLSRVLHQKSQHLLLRYTANFEAFCAAAITGKNSNSRLGCFQKVGKEFDQGLIGPVFDGGRLQPDLQRSAELSGHFILARPWLHTYRKDYTAGPVFNIQNISSHAGLFCAARPEERRSDAHFRGAFFDRHFKIVGHAHRKDGQRAPELLRQAVAQFA